MAKERENRLKRLTIGIDVGGTNTDGVLYDTEARRIISSVKTPTNHADYRDSIEAALGRLLRAADSEDIISLNISTTLSTNALLEGKGAPVALVLIGYEDFPHIKDEILRTVSPAALLSVRGGHNGWGNEREPLDRESLARFAKEEAGGYFAVSSLYSPRNPLHEMEAAGMIRAAGCAGLTCGHEMARSKLNSVKSTVTAFLNSSLIDVTERLIQGVEFCAASHGLRCPVMFLRSDSSLVCGRWCARFQLETVFSGPAASMRGAMLLGGVRDEDAVVADMGGTSTDIGVVKKGKAVYSKEGALIGNYRTMIPSLEIRSIALGGDSAVKLGKGGELTVGPERVRPYCRASEGEECGYTPSDALSALGAAAIGSCGRSLRASNEYGGRLGVSAVEFARLVRGEVSKRLSEALHGSGEESRRICVGAPVASFACGADCSVQEEAAIASAVGAASSSLSLSCTVSILHSFFDGNFYAFLPAGQIRGTDFESVYSRSRAALEKYLTEQAALMGFQEAAAEISEELEYIVKERSLLSLSAVTLNGKAVVHDA
ncbi:MAG: hydantoinase/oxoprolinase family protein [Synergistaceae bacterium]|nr:hydantoinase/oxoprolinase family protein [Synergistaceae bacterium]